MKQKYVFYTLSPNQKDDIAFNLKLKIKRRGISSSFLCLMPRFGFLGGASDRVCIFCTVLLLVIIACAVYLFIWSGMIWGSYAKVLQIGDYTPENKRLNKKTGWFAGVYWCIVVAVYLLISFLYDNWEISWVIWPVAGVLFAALNQIVRKRAEKE